MYETKQNIVDTTSIGQEENASPELFGSHFGTYAISRPLNAPPTLEPFFADSEPSPLGRGFIELADHPVRITRPCIRRSWLNRGPGAAPELRACEPFVEVDWDTALEHVQGALRQVISKHGNRAIFGGSYGWASAGRFHHAQSQLKRFLNLTGGFVSAVNTYSYGAATVLLPHVIGPEHAGACDTSSTWDRIAENTEVMLAFGGLRTSNAQVEAGGCGRHRVGEWLRRSHRNGMRLFVLSPLRSDVPEGLSARHIPVRPGTDTAVMLGMAYAILAAKRENSNFIERYTSGFTHFRDHVFGVDDGIAKTPKWAAAVSGVPASVIEELAYLLVARRSFISVSWSLQRIQYGEQPYWTAIALACLAGHIGQPGGGFGFGLGSVNSVGQPVRRLRGPALPQGRNPVREFIPVARIADMLLSPGGHCDYNGQRLAFPDIRLVYWCGGNPFHHHQDINRLRRALRKPETIIVHENTWTAMARHADIVLPTALPTERTDIAASSRDNWLIYSQPVTRLPAGIKTDHQIFIELSRRFGCEEAFTDGRDEAGWLQHLYEGYRSHHPELPDFDLFCKTGYASLDGLDDAPEPGDLFAAFIADPEGAPLKTPTGRIEMSSDTIARFGYDDCPGHPAWLEPAERLGSRFAEKYPLQLLSNQPAHRLHGQLDAASASRNAKVAGREAVRIHPRDAATRGITTGDVVRLFNDRGACLAGAILDESLMPGVVVLPTGATYDPDDSSSNSPLDLHGNPNVLTSDRGTSRLSQGPAVDCLVQAERYPAPPPVRAFTPPDIESCQNERECTNE